MDGTSPVPSRSKSSRVRSVSWTTNTCQDSPGASSARSHRDNDGSLATTNDNATTATTHPTHSPKSLKRKSSSLPPETVEYLKKWILSPEHIAHPYPTEQEKAKIMKETGIEMKQLTNWFVNNRKRFWKPRVEAQLKEQKNTSTDGTASPVMDAEGSSQADAATLKPSRLNNATLGDAMSTLTSKTPATMQDTASVSSNETPEMVSPRSTATTASSAVVLIGGAPNRGRVVSAQSSVVSDSGELTSSESLEDLCSAGQEKDIDDDDEEEKFIVKQESITLHILRPTTGNQRLPPSWEDISLDTDDNNMAPERLLHSFRDVTVSYRCLASEAHDPKKWQNKREMEILRLKKKYWNKYMSEFHPTRVPTTLPLMDRMTGSSKKRRRIHHDDEAPTPRLMFRRVSVDLWKEACQTADSIYDHKLPSLEEAATLFGYKSDHYCDDDL